MNLHRVGDCRVREVEEEEGSSSTAGKDDHKGNDAYDENQAEDAPE